MHPKNLECCGWPLHRRGGRCLVEGKSPFDKLFEVNVISAHSPFAIGLFYHDHIGQPGGVVCFFDEANFY